MLSASAYSFRQKSRLAISLSWVAGFTNVIAFMICGQLVSHMTGNTTQFARYLGAGKLPMASHFASILAAFLCGAIASGCMTEGARRSGARSKYILPLAIEGIILAGISICISRYGLSPAHPLAEYGALSLGVACAAAFAMGLQNATITKISGSVVRTTHLTGVITDLGLEGVQYLLWVYDRSRGGKHARMSRIMRVSRRHPELQRLAVLASIFASFLAGAVLGTALFERFPSQALLAPVAFILFVIWVDWRKPIADVKELDLLSDPQWTGYESLKSILPPELGIHRLTYFGRHRRHATPDMVAWADRLPKRWRVIILAVTPMTAFDAEAAMDLGGALRKLRSQRRDLIICGLHRQQYRILHKAGVVQLLGLENVCPDLDFAIARGLNRVQELVEPNER